MFSLETSVITINVEPCSKPRMTRSDKWKKRQCVTKFFAFRDAIKQEMSKGTKLDIIPYDIEFYVQIPKSWSKKKKEEHIGKPHLPRPDLDNYIKAWNDSVFEEDSVVWKFKASKLWTDKPGHIKISSL